MKVEHLEVMVEEPSMETMLRFLLPKILGEVTFAIYPFRSKQDLLGKLPSRLRAYSRYVSLNTRILILIDRDNDDCKQLKAMLENMAKDARLRTRTQARSDAWQVVNRIVIEELESWYFGDWDAVRAAYPKVPATIPSQAKYRDPDAIVGTWETFERVLQKAGYFSSGLRKIEAARTIAPLLEPARNSSRSFQALCSALNELVG